MASPKMAVWLPLARHSPTERSFPGFKSRTLIFPKGGYTPVIRAHTLPPRTRLVRDDLAS